MATWAGVRRDDSRLADLTVDLDYIAFVRYDTESGDQYVALWPSGRQFVRRSASATSVGPPEVTTDALS